MASLVLGVVGTAVAGPVGTVVGTIAGAAIDYYVIGPALFPEEEVDVPSEDLNQFITTGQEGTVSRWPIGTVRVPGMVIWKSPLVPTGNSEAPTWSIDVAIAASSVGKEIVAFREVFANNKKIYDAVNQISVTSTDIEARATYYSNLTSMNLVSTTVDWGPGPPGGPAGENYRIGQGVTISGFSNAGNNGNYDVWDWFALGSEWHMVVGLNPTRVQEAAGQSVTVLQDIFPYNPSKITNFTFYNGTNTQGPDSLIESYEGSGLVPGFVGTPYVMIQGLRLEDYGNRLPDFELLIEANSTPTVGDAISELLVRAGRDSSTFDTSACTDSLRGFYVETAANTRNSLQILMQTFNLLAQDRGGVLTFFPRNTAEVVTLSGEDLAAHQEGEDAPRIAQYSPRPNLRLPKEVTVKFQEFGNDYQKGSQRERLINAPSEATVGLNLTVVLTSEEARQLARRKLWSDNGSRARFEIQLPPSYLKIIESDVVQFVDGDTTYNGIILERNMGVNDLMELRGVVELTSASTQAMDADDPVTPQVGPLTPFLRYELLDIPALTNTDAMVEGAYYAGLYTDPNIDWAGGGLYKSVDNFNFDLFGEFENAGIIGETTDALPRAHACYWDRVNTVDIRLSAGIGLSSVSEQQVYSGANMVLIGDEVLAFQDAESLSGDNYWRLSVLLRGLRSTTWASGTHTAGTRAVVLQGSQVSRGKNSKLVQFGEITPPEVNTNFYWRAVPTGEQVEDVDSVQQTLTAVNRIPFPPAHLRGRVTTPGPDLTVFADFQTTGIHSHFVGQKAKNYDFSNITFEIDCRDGRGRNSNHLFTGRETGTNPLVTRIGQRAQLTLTLARRLELGLATNDPVTFEVYQVSDTYGRGRAAIITLDPADPSTGRSP